MVVAEVICVGSGVESTTHSVNNRFHLAVHRCIELQKGAITHNQEVEKRAGACKS
jgi:hypothetical protein